MKIFEILNKIYRKIKMAFRYGMSPIATRTKLQKLRLAHAELIPGMRSFSQNGQDHYLAQHVFHRQQGGFFVDIGAYDGETGSNTAFFECELNWGGVCFEPNPIPYSLLKERRKCSVVNACIGTNNSEVKFAAVHGPCEQLSGISDFFSARHKERLKLCLREHGGKVTETIISIINLQDYCAENQITRIDLLCIDVEGAEMIILNSLSFEHLDIRTIVVENNYHGDEPVGFLMKKGFQLIAMIGCDEIYVRNSTTNTNS